MRRTRYWFLAALLFLAAFALRAPPAEAQGVCRRDRLIWIPGLNIDGEGVTPGRKVCPTALPTPREPATFCRLAPRPRVIVNDRGYFAEPELLVWLEGSWVNADNFGVDLNELVWITDEIAFFEFEAGSGNAQGFDPEGSVLPVQSRGGTAVGGLNTDLLSASVEKVGLDLAHGGTQVALRNLGCVPFLDDSTPILILVGGGDPNGNPRPTPPPPPEPTPQPTPTATPPPPPATPTPTPSPIYGSTVKAFINLADSLL